MSIPDRSRLLRTALLGNAALSTACVVGLVTWIEPLTRELGVGAPWLYALAAGLLGFVAMLVWQASRPQLDTADAMMTSLGDGAWVLGSAVVLVVQPEALTALGSELVAAVALGVGTAGVAQLFGIRRLIAEPDPGRSTRNRVEVVVDVEAEREAMWSVVADLGAIERFSPALASSFVRDGAAPGKGAVRECASDRGQRWAERVIDWQPGRSFEIDFLTEEPGFPFPMAPMVGGWRLESQGPSHTRVTLWWSFDTTPAWVAPLLVPLLARRMRRDFPPVVRAMAAQARGMETIAAPGALHAASA